MITLAGQVANLLKGGQAKSRSTNSALRHWICVLSVAVMFVGVTAIFALRIVRRTQLSYGVGQVMASIGERRERAACIWCFDGVVGFRFGRTSDRTNVPNAALPADAKWERLNLRRTTWGTPQVFDDPSDTLLRRWGFDCGSTKRAGAYVEDGVTKTYGEQIFELCVPWWYAAAFLLVLALLPGSYLYRAGMRMKHADVRR